MGAAKKIIVWLALIVLMIVSASANIPREAEKCVWEKIGLGVESCQINELEASHWELDKFELRLEVAVNPLLDPDGRLATGFATGYVGGAFAKSQNLTQGIGQAIGTLGSYLTPGLGEFALVRDTVGGAMNVGAGLGRMWENGVNWVDALDVAINAVGTVLGVKGMSPQPVSRPPAAVFMEDNVRLNLGNVDNAGIRQAYESEVKALKDLGNSARAAGQDAEATARMLNAERNALKLQYRKFSPPDFVKQAESRNVRLYGDPVGPSVEYFRAEGKTWEQIIEKAARPGGGDLGF